MTPDREHLELYVPDEPDPRIPAHPRLVPDPPRRSGCVSVVGWLLLAVVVVVWR